MRYHCHVLVDLNRYQQKHYGLISTVGWNMKTQGLNLRKHKK